MKKYYIEGNINFYEELFKTLDQEENIEEENVCLITNLPLKDRYVKLQCGHKFNYDSLYNDLVNYKTKFNNMEKVIDRLDKNEIRCPYCRNKQKELLPFYDDLPFKKVKGVNSLHENVVEGVSLKQKRCQYMYPPNNVDGISIQCLRYGYPLNTMSDQINVHIIANNLPIIDTDKAYCCLHSKLVIKEFIKKQKAVEKEKIKQIKEADKQKAKEEKLIEKQKEKEARQKEKEEKQKMKKKLLETELVNETNDIIQMDIDKCTEILKSGANKGEKCNQKAFNECLCKRHYNLKNKDKK